MAKKRAREADGAAPDPDKMQEDESSDDESLLRQLLDVDSQLFDISGLADLILSQPTIGSTVKTDGKEADPYAMLTALNLQEHRAKKPLADLIQYLGEKAKATESLSALPELLASGQHVGLVLSERLINMPSEIAPPMYNLLADEVEAAVEDGEPYVFSHYLVLSKTYHEVESTLDVEERRKKKGKVAEPATYYFHPEDEVLQKHALAHGSYAFTKNDEAVADSKRAFQEMGIVSKGHLILIEAGKFGGAIKAMNEYLSPPS
ncbi:hypothetical protein JX265_011389 [Neoarthrinium moseri]|uniref:Protein BCP1 n=1 Tax=Neoarthrinium moseri TaxID=1658444 RepID=A0A9P9WCA1_9PEZI|nr:uncharacterized protein JN550_000909 [Neoarthrinium moseri]KAI1853108.1 hypothetical protein JX266_001814 [Neoarthrinium moseri]KAI1856748.1 hypothetical protein JX265_011389 [Neoarthrinium moseri]KAI1876837.1 hypothetical protein JN550_000909 [Neoarthrinium moseri]